MEFDQRKIVLAPEDVWALHPDLLLPYDSDKADNRETFKRAIFVAFGIDDEPLLQRTLCNRDFLWSPEAYVLRVLTVLFSGQQHFPDQFVKIVKKAAWA